MRIWGRYIFILLMIVILYLFLFLTFNSVGYYLFLGWPWEHEAQNRVKNIYPEILSKTLIDEQNYVQIPKALLGKLDPKKEWLQIVDEQGKEIFQYQKPEKIPKQYSIYELSNLKKGNLASGYQIYTLYANIDGRGITWVFGYAPIDTELLKRSTYLEEDKVKVSHQAIAELKKENAWLQVLDEKGTEVFQYHRPSSFPKQYHPGQFVYYDEEDNSEQHIYHMIDTIDGKSLIWVIGFSEPVLEKYYRYFGIASDQQEKDDYVVWSSLVSYILSLLIVAIIFAWRFTGPMVHIMNWLKQLAVGKYEEPQKNGRPASISRISGKLKRSYRDFIEVIQAMRYLTYVLKKNEEDRNKLEKTREEWLTGVSHDLKTPLSAVKGYADLLAEPQYEWSKDEVQQYARVIQEKAHYMENLINDLNLTFRLKNDALPLNRERYNLVELVRRAVIDLANDPRAEVMDIDFVADLESIIYPVDTKWFKRALNNFLVNAVVHNPAGTKITVQVKLNEAKDRAIIIIEDTGVGMSENTLAHLFDRYYRGSRSLLKETGSGLGMAIAEQLVKAHDGEIHIESKEGKGTKIELHFLLREDRKLDGTKPSSL
jgi:signal transduction histidine kinase